jgi:hypothetical protein
MGSGAQAIQRCGRKLFQVELALLALLHTWGQLLNSHLHSHGMLPAGGLWRKGWDWVHLSPEEIRRLLACVSRELPEVFLRAVRKAYERGELVFGDEPELEGLQAPAAFERWLEPLGDIAWVIRCPQVWDRRRDGNDPEASARTVAYLARYANRVALSNNRIVGIEGDRVLLRYKDYRDGDAMKIASIDGVELIGRFLRHLLPKGMHHIRRYGWMGRRTKNEKLVWLRSYFGVAEPQPVEEPQPENQEAEPAIVVASESPSRACRYCSGTMRLTRATDRPKVSEILEMPREWFRDARAGAIITLGEKVTSGRGRGPPADPT